MIAMRTTHRCLLVAILFAILCFCDGAAVASLARRQQIDAPIIAKRVQSESSLSIPQRLGAGGSSRAVAQMLLYPVDALRTLAQTRDHRTLADVGARALVRGCTITSSFALFIGAIQFGIFGATRKYVGPVLASALGAAGSCIVSVPQEVVKQRLVTGVYSSFRQACKTIYQQEGIRGFYSAWRPTMIRNVPFVVVTFTANDVIKNKILSKRGNESKELSVRENLVVGISSALLGAVVTHPADVVKTRMMTQAASTAIPYTSNMDCIRTIAKTEGIAPFFSGFVQRSLYMGKEAMACVRMQAIVSSAFLIRLVLLYIDSHRSPLGSSVCTQWSSLSSTRAQKQSIAWKRVTIICSPTS